MRTLYLAIFTILILLVSCQQGGTPGDGAATENMEHSHDAAETMGEMDPSSMSEGVGHEGEHEDHDPKHGGIFFMALDEIHHLEGTLTPQGWFRVYLHDEFTLPLTAERVKQAGGTIHWGEFPDPPGIPLKVGAEEGSLEAKLERELELPVTLTLLLRLPGSDPAEEPELFTFVFDDYSPDR